MLTGESLRPKRVPRWPPGPRWATSTPARSWARRDGGQRHRRGRGHRRTHGVRPHRPRAGRPAARDRVPARPATLLGAAAQIALALTSFILVRTSFSPDRFESMLFSLAIAVGITPQLRPLSSAPASRPDRAAWRGGRCWSSGWSASKTSATWTCWSPTRRERSPRAHHLQAALDPDGAPSDEVLGLAARQPVRRDRHQPARRGDHRGRTPRPRAPQGGVRALRPRTADDLGLVEGPDAPGCWS